MTQETNQLFHFDLFLLPVNVDCEGAAGGANSALLALTDVKKRRQTVTRCFVWEVSNKK